MSIKHEFMSTLREMENVSPIRFYNDLQLHELALSSRIKKKWNACTMWDLFVPDVKKTYSILNTDDSSKKGTHWVAVFQSKKTLYVYDSFARSKALMKAFVSKMEHQDYKIVFVNKGQDQPDTSVNCGLYCLVWLIFVDKYGIRKASHI